MGVCSTVASVEYDSGKFLLTINDKNGQAHDLTVPLKFKSPTYSIGFSVVKGKEVHFCVQEFNTDKGLCASQTTDVEICTLRKSSKMDFGSNSLGFQFMDVSVSLQSRVN